VDAAGLEHRPPYALRHSFASWSIAAGIGLFELSRLMGTSVEQLDKTYGHLLPDSLHRARMALDGYAAAANGARKGADV
jgi:integrase